MKTHITLLAIAAVVINTAWISPASSPVISKETTISAAADPSFSVFRVHRQGKNGVSSTWALTSEEGVIGFTLEKTYEDASDPYAYWETVTTLPASGQRTYKHTDTGVYPGLITYRVTAHLTGSRSVVSAIETIQIVSH